jgi:hypothetical protein
LGGNGGGGNGAWADSPVTAGNVNTGGGGGATRGADTSSGRPGGSGVVILRYADSFVAANATTGSPNVTVSGGYRIYRFWQSGSIQF